MKKIKLRPLGEWVYVDMSVDAGEKVRESGLIIPDDDMKDHGIRPRWCEVLALGPKFSEDIKPGDRLLLEHLGWTRPIPVETEDGETIKVYLTSLDKILLHEPRS